MKINLNVVGFRRYTVVTFGSRSAIERLFGYIEWKIRRFWNGFIGKDPKGVLS